MPSSMNYQPDHFHNWPLPSIFSTSQYCLVTETYTVSQKSIPNIFDCNLKTNYHRVVVTL